MKIRNYIYPILLEENIVNSFSSIEYNNDILDSKTESPFFTLMLVPSEKCNLHCKYCYETNKDYKLMDISFAKKTIENAFKNLKDNLKLKIEIRGGEPFLEFEWIKTIFEWVKSNYKKDRYFFYIVTNGTCFTKEIKKFLLSNKEEFFIALSLDGNENTHNSNRCNSFNLIDFDFLFKMNSTPYTYTTIIPENVNNMYEDIIFLLKMGFSSRINFEFISNWNDQQIKTLVIQLKNIADYILSNNIKNSLNLFSSYSISDYTNKTGNYNRRFELNCNAGKQRIIYTTDEEMYPCHAFVPSVFNNFSKDNIIDISENTILNPDMCCNCNYFYLCHICIGFSYNYKNSLTWRNESLCKITICRTFASAYYQGMIIYNKIINNEILSERDKRIAYKIYLLYKEEKIFE
ncbi:4Fe-4S cluster-binding domain-containing protein [Brachyspira intermedia]|uniref:radical SAM protein n=1 Tax=Brachyspira intermedia TaxID=84377 RepID=UPI003004E64A